MHITTLALPIHQYAATILIYTNSKHRCTFLALGIFRIHKVHRCMVSWTINIFFKFITCNPPPPPPSILKSMQCLSIYGGLAMSSQYISCLIVCAKIKKKGVEKRGKVHFLLLRIFDSVCSNSGTQFIDTKLN